MSSEERDAESRRLFLKLGLWNGSLIGLALALGTWSLEAVSLSRTHVQLALPALLLGGLALLLLGGLAGLLAAGLARAAMGGLVWLVAAGLMTWTISHLPYEGRSLIVWLSDRRFAGLPIYPFSPPAQARLFMTGFFIVLLLTILGLVQDFRLEGIAAETGAGGRLDSRAWFLLLLPLPLVLGAGLIADNLVNSPLRSGPQLVHEAIRTGRTYPGDLFAFSLERGVNYNAIAGVRDQMSAGYSLLVGEVELGAATIVSVVAHFDNGAWINCRVMADQLSHCYDASPPYLRGFPALVTGETLADCQECYVRVSDEQRVSLRAWGQGLAGPPVVTRLAQRGSHVLMRAASPTGESAMECLLRGISPVRLEYCRETE